MGNTTSEDIKEELQSVDQAVAAAPSAERPPGVRLYRFVKAGTTGKWEPRSANASIQFYSSNENSEAEDWHLEIPEADIDVRVDHGMQYMASESDRRVTFFATESVFALKFPDIAAFNSFKQQLQDKMFYNTYQRENDEEGRAKVFGDDFANALYTSAAPTMEEADAMDAEPTAPVVETAMEKKGSDPIEAIIMGGLDNTFFLRGTTFDVMRNDVGGLIDAELSFPITPAGHKGGLTPSKVLLAGAETKMNMISPLQPNRLFHTDIETGKVVSEWTFQKDGVEIPIRDIATDSKSAQFEESSTFLGLDVNRLCRWDLRDRRGVVQESPVVEYKGGKDFARGTNFSCMAASGDGYVVVGSKDGKVRLYNNKTLTQAKTSIPSLGSPITAVDVTYQGDWVVATADDYLLVLHTIFEDKSGQKTNGFVARMGKNFPTPRLLRLKPEDTLLTEGRPLRKAKFTWITEQGKKERHIVASCGRFSVVWDFQRVKAATDTTSIGGLPTSFDYYLTSEKDGEVVDSSFMHDRFTPGKGKPTVVASTPNKWYNIRE